MAMIMALLIVALTSTGAGTLTLLHSYLQGQVDDKLYAAVDLASKQRSFTQLQAPNPMVPTDYSLILYTPGEDPQLLGGDPNDHPDIATISVEDAQNRAPARTRSVAPTARTGGWSR
ncbi:histidine kinase [Arthrobacter sp. Hiyo4]|nr:histidine kinase [Arthrobacter sp. Hiyo4]